VLPRFFKFASRKDSLSSFILTVGAVDAVMGGVGDRVSLLVVGLLIVGTGIGVRWWKFRERPVAPLGQDPVPVRYLPDRTSRPSLPMLQMPDKRPPG
jgi:hypothetical protein